MKRVMLIVAAVALQSFLSFGVVTAQDFDRPTEKVLEGMYNRQVRLPTSGATSFDYSTASAYSPSMSWFRQPNMFCPSGSKNCDAEELNFQPQTGARVNRMNYYGSMMGFAAGMNAKVHSDATVNTYLPGDLSLTYITLGLTEPSVANGLAQAVNYIGNDVNNRLQAEQTFFSQMAVMPEVGQQLGQAHIACIAEEQSKGFNWMVAQAHCTGDSGDKAAFGANKFKFEDDSGGIARVNFANDKSWHDDGTLPTTGESDEQHTIRLSDYLFNQEAEKQESNEYWKLKKDFVELAGDIVYHLKEETDPNNQGQVSLSFTKVNPTKTDPDSGADISSFEAQFQFSTHRYYDNLLILLKEYCKWIYVPGSGPTGPAAEKLDFNSSASGANRSDWWWFTSPLAGGGDFSLYASVPGFNFTPMHMDGLLGLYNAIFPPTSPIPPVYCENLDHQSGPFKWDTVTTAGNIRDQGPLVRAVFFMAQRLGLAYNLQRHMILRSFVKKVTLGSFDTVAREAAFKLLDEAAIGHPNIEKEYEENVAELRKYGSDISNYRHQVVGTQARQIQQQAERGGTTQQSAINAAESTN